ncbi:MAG: SIS domain-containing protein [Chloroflexales bacterium]|nr:SIS domain-containing protein [Chloroflexales bacterium]
MISFLEQEIHSQPAVIARLLEQETARIDQIVAQLPPFDYVLMAARGTSDHAATYAKYVWPALAGYPVALAAPSLHTLYHTPPRLNGALVVGVSQSGQSPDIVAVLAEGRRQGRPTLAITNDGGSPLATAADHVIELYAGPERSVAATKTYTAQLTAMAMLGSAWRQETERQAELQRLPETLAAVLERAGDIAPRVERYRYMQGCVVIGRGYNYATALELSLKLKELTYITTTAYSSADFRHGPIATISAGLPVILIMPRGATFDDMHHLAQDLVQRGAELLIISDEPSVYPMATTVLPQVSGLPEWLSPIPAIVPGQLLALHLAQIKGFDPDRPRGLQKVTHTL